MNKKRLFLLSGGVLVVMLVVGLVGAAVASAQGPVPARPASLSQVGWGRGGWMAFDVAAEALGLDPEQFFAELHAGKTLAQIAEEQGVEVQEVHAALRAARAADSNRWSKFDTTAQALGLTPEAFFAELHAGKTVAQIAEEQGVEMKEVRAALRAQKVEALKESIQQAVEKGRLSQEQADWLSEGLEKGFIPERLLRRSRPF